MPGRRTCRPLAVAATLSLVLGGTSLPAGAAALRGKVEVLAGRGRSLDPAGAVVWLDRLPGGMGPAAPATRVVETRGKQFRPRVLALSVGDHVRFPNADPILHNVFSVSPGNLFDLGLYGKGEGKEVVLRSPGVVRAYCNVHAQMVAFLVVCPSQRFALVRPDGSFEISPAPPGTYDVVVWHERGGTETRTVTVGSSDLEVRFSLDASRFRRRPHLDKSGRPYRPDAETDPYR